MTKIRFLIVLITMLSINTNAQKQIDVADFGVTEQTADCTQGVIKSINACKRAGDAILIFKKGTYHFDSDYGKDKYCFISNNDEGLKRIVFLIEEMKDLTIDGQGSSFIFHGFINPFAINNSKNVKLKNFSIDFVRPFHSEATIIANNADGIDLEIPKNYPYRINNGTLIFTDGDKEEGQKTTVSKEIVYEYGHLLEFDTKKRETAFMAHDYYLGGTPLVAKSLGERKVRVYMKDLKGTVGNTMVFGFANRNYPAFLVSDSRDIRFENVTIFHAGGMGIVCQRTRNVSVISCKVQPSEGRIISTTADATHFTNCTGKIELGYSVFQNQMDDATNIHGIYAQIAERVSPKEFIVQLKHIQQLGFDFLKQGALVEFIQGKSLITKGQAKVLESKSLNKDFIRIKLSTELPVGIKIGDAIGEVSDSQFVHIHDNYIGQNRARGMLLNCSGKTIVENNRFHSPGAAILFEGDASFWFEQGGVTDCTIQNNIFDNCLFGVWGNAIIAVGAGITENKDTSRYNKNIKVLNNTFRTFDEGLLLQAYCVDGLVWKGNRIEKTTDYPTTRVSNTLFKVESSDNINIDQETSNNKYVYVK